jgi:methionyl-tRNA formyltransferase
VAPLRIIFCGTPAFAVRSLRLLLGLPEFTIEGVVTQPDRARGRGNEVSDSAVKSAALAAGIPVYQPQKIRAEEVYEYFRGAAPDVVVIIAYGQIIPARLIEIPRLGWINLHGSLLPKYRGAAPIHWAIANGETRTGLTTMRIDAGLDTGPVLMKYETEIGAEETAPELYARLAEAGAPLMADTLRGIEVGAITAVAQDDAQASLARPLKKEDGRIDWSLAARKIYDRMRGFQPWPGAFTSFRGKQCALWGRPELGGEAAGDSTRLAVGTILVSGGEVDVVCGEGTALRVEFVQVEGRKRIAAREFANGARLMVGEKFGS